MTYAGQTLAQLADAHATDPAGVLAELQARVARNGKSAKNAQKAIERITAGEGVAIPARPEPTPEQVQARAEREARKAAKGAKTVNPNARIVVANARAKGVVTAAQAYALVAAEGRACGFSIPRWISAGAKGRAPVAKA